MPIDPSADGRDDALAHAALDAELVDLEQLTPESLALPQHGGSTSLTPWLTDNPALRLDFILESQPEDWYASYALPVLAHFRHDAIQWGRIEARWGALFQKGDNLRNAVDMWLREHPASVPFATEPPSPEERLKVLFESTVIEEWYGAMELLADIYPSSVQWGFAKEKARQRGLNAYALEQAVKEVVAARRKKAKHLAENRGNCMPLPAQGHESALALLSDEWGIPIVECLRHGTDNATWHLTLTSGKEINLGDSKNLLSEAAVRIAIFDVTGRAIQEYGKKGQGRWHELVELVAAIAVTIDTPEMSARGQALALLLAYLEAQDCHLDHDASDEEWETLAKGQEPFVRQGKVYLHARHIWSAFARTMMPEHDHAHILECLRLLGGYPEKMTLNTYKTSRMVWGLPLTALMDMTGGEEMPTGKKVEKVT